MNTMPQRTAALMIVLALALAACGRAGAPQLPPTASGEPAQDRSTPQTAQDKPFVLDPLLN